MAKKITAEDYKKLYNLLEEVAADYDTLEPYDENTSEEDKIKLAYGYMFYFALHENGYFYGGESNAEGMSSEEYKALLEA